MSRPDRAPEMELFDEGRAEMDLGDLDAAIGFFEKALSVRVHFKTLELLGECHLKKRQFEQAITYLAAAVTLNRGVRAASLLATAFYESGSGKYRTDTPAIIEIVLERDSKNRNALELKKRLAEETTEITE